MKKSFHYLKLIVLAAAVLLFFSTRAAAVTNTASAVGGGTWATATWSQGHIPTSAEDAVINSGINLNIDTAAVCASLAIGNATATATTLTVTTGSLSVTTAGGGTGNLTLNPSSVANAITLTLNGTTTLTVSGNVTVNQPGGVFTDALNINGGSATVSGNVSIGGANTTATHVAKIAVTTGSLSVTGSVTYTSNITAATEVITVTTGTLTFSTALTLSSGTLSVTSTGTINLNLGMSFGSANAPVFTTTLGCTVKFGGSLTATTTALTLIAGSTAEFTGSSTVTATAAITFGDLQIDSTVPVTLSGSITVAGNWTNNGGTLSGGTTVTLSGASKTIGGTATTAFPGLTIGSGASYTMNNDNSCTALVIGIANAAATSLTQSGTTALTVNGNVTIHEGNNLTVVWNINAGSATVSGNVTLGDATNKTVAKIVVTTGTLSITGNLVYSVTGATAAVVDLSGGAATLNLAGALTLSTLGTLTPGTSSTVNYNGSGAQTITFASAISYFNLTLSNAGTKTAGAAMTVNGDFTISGAATFAGGTSLTHTFLGNWIVNTSAATPFSFTTASTINFNTPGTPAATSLSSGSSTATLGFNNVTLNNTSGFSTTKNFNITGTFTIAAGVTFTPTATAVVGSTGAMTVSGTAIVAATTFAGNYALSGTKTLNAGSTINYTAASPTIDVSAVGSSTVPYQNLTFSGTGSASLSGTPLVIQGTLANTGGGTLAFGSNNVTINGALAQNIAGFTTTGTVTSNKTALTATFTGNMSLGSLTMGTTGGTVNLGVGLTHTLTGNVTLTAGTLNGGSSTLNVAGTWTGAATFTASTGTVDFNGGTQTLSTTATTFNNLQIDNAGTKTLGSNTTVVGTLTIPVSTTLSCSTFTLSVAGNFTVNGTLSGTGAITLGTGSANLDGTGSITNTTTLTISTAKTFLSSANLSFTPTIAISTAITVTNNGTVTTTAAGGITGISGTTWTQGTTGVLNVAGPLLTTTGTVLTANASGNTVNYTGASQTVKATATYHHLTLSGSGTAVLTTTTTAVNGNFTMSGTVATTTVVGLAIGGQLIVGSGTTFTAAAFALTVTGNTSVTGTLTISSATGTKAFNGDLTVNTNGTWNNTAANVALTLPGSISNSGTFNAGTGVYTLSGTTKTISGTFSSTSSIPSVTVSGTYQNNGTLTVTTALADNAGVGTLTNGAAGTLNINFTGSVALTNLTATAVGNTVNYGFAGTQQIKATTYHHLTLSNTSAKTAFGGLTVNGDFTITGAATFAGGTSLTHTFLGNWIVNTSAAAPFASTSGGIINFNTPGTPAATSISGSSGGIGFSASNVFLNNTSGFSSSVNLSIGNTKNLTVATGVTFTPSSGVVVSGTIGTGTLTGFGTVQVTAATGSADFENQYTIGTKTLTNLTVEFVGASAQGTAFAASNFGNLKMNNSNGLTLGANVTVDGLLTFASGNIATGSNILTMGSAATATRTSGHVIGSLEKTSVPGSFTFHVGTATANGYTPLALANATLGGSLRVTTVAGVEPAVDQTNSLKEYWTLAVTLGSLKTDMTFTYLQSDVQGTETSYRLIRVDSGTAVSFLNECPIVDTLNACVDTSANTAQIKGVSNFSNWTVGAPLAPTAVKLARFKSTAFSDGVMLEWTSGFEANNLGYNLYRIQDGQRARVTPSLIAGSALRARNSVLRTGFSYGWFDREGTAGTQYVLEAVDLNGETVEYAPQQAAHWGAHEERPRSMLLNEIGASMAKVSARAAERGWATGAKPFSDAPSTTAATVGSTPVTTQSLLTQQWIAAQPAVKISVNHSGWYRVTQSQLVAAGFDPTTDARLLQLYADAQEQPIRIAGDQANLGPSDTIEFYGVGLDTLTTDTHTYYLVLGNHPGLRIDAKPDKGKDRDPKDSTPVAQEFSYSIERKDRVIYLPGLFNGDGNNILGAPIYSSPATETLTLRNLDAAAAPDAQLEVVLQGYTAVNHQVQVQLNGAYVGTVTFSGIQHPTTQFPITSAMLKEGDNTVTLTAAGGDADLSFADTVRVAYPHSYRADSDSLSFTVPGGQSALVTGFSTSHIRVVDITDPNAPHELLPTISQQSDSSYGFRVGRPPWNTTRSLIAFADQLAAQPAAVFRNVPSTLNTSTNAADLVIITHADFSQSVEPLAAARRAQGLKVAVVDVEDVYDEFSYGTHTPQALRDFLARASSNWATKPQYVLLVGDSSWDPRNYMDKGYNDFVPTKLIDTAELETSSDPWLVDFNDDGDPALAVGRLPVRTAADATIMVNKILAYDQERAVGHPLQRGALLVSDAGFESQTSEVASQLAPVTSVQTINRSVVANDAQARSQIVTAIDNGPAIVNYFGHGSVDVWTSAPLLDETDGAALTNSNRLSLFVMMTCLNGYFHDAYIDSLGETLLKDPQGGAFAVWASSGLTEPDGQALMNKQLYQLLLSDQATTLGQAIRGAKLATTDLDVRRTWTLLGDPSMRIR